jgi:HEAT repeat protein
LLKHSEVFVRRDACDLLQVIGTNESVSALQAAQKDDNKVVAKAAGEALSAINARQAK